MNSENILTGQLLEDHEMITIGDLCRSCSLEIETVTILVDEGILDPVGSNIRQWQFTVTSLKRVKTAMHLQRDLGVNLAGAALALELLDRIAELERR